MKEQKLGGGFRATGRKNNHPNGITVGGSQSKSPHVTQQKRLAGIWIGKAFC